MRSRKKEFSPPETLGGGRETDHSSENHREGRWSGERGMSVFVYSSTVVLSGEGTGRVRTFISRVGAGLHCRFLKKDRTGNNLARLLESL